MDMRLRLATLADAERLAPLYRNSYTVLMGPAYDPAVLAAALPAMTAPQPALLSSGSYFIAERDAGAILGAGGWTFGKPGSGETAPGLAHIRHFAVNPAQTGQGVGRMLFQRCRETALAAGAKRFLCFSSLNGVPFYAAMGFAEIAHREVPIADGPGFPVVEMALDLI